MNNTFKISIDELENSADRALSVEFSDVISEIDDELPVQADLCVKSLGEFVEVKGHVTGSVNLECDLCLKKFVYNYDFDIDEVYAKNGLMLEYGQETELKSNEFVEDLKGTDEIDIYDLLYQSVILNLPNKKVCGINCNEGVFESDENFKNPDTRMEVFKNIKIVNSKEPKKK